MSNYFRNGSADLPPGSNFTRSSSVVRRLPPKQARKAAVTNLLVFQAESRDDACKLQSIKSQNDARVM